MSNNEKEEIEVTNISVLGIGDFGRKTINAYSFEIEAIRSCKTIGDFNLYIENHRDKETSVPLYRVKNDMYDIVYSAELGEVYANTDVLYIVVDTNNDVDFQNAISYAKLQEEYSKVQGYSVCISCGCCEMEKIEELRKAFDYVIFTDVDSITKCRPIRLLVNILTRHICELEMADVSYISEQAPIMYYCHYSIENKKDFSIIIDKVKKELSGLGVEINRSNIIAYFSFNKGDDYFESIIPLLSCFDNCIYQVGINEEMKNVEVSFVCGQIEKTEQ